MIPSNRKVKTAFFKTLTGRFNVLHSDYFTLRTYLTPGEKSKFSVIISKKIEKNAVDRNLVKRMVYEELRLLLPKMKNELICLLFVKKTFKNIDFKLIKEDIFFVLRKAGVLT